MVMPGINGLELSKQICTAHPEAKVLFMTGFGDQFPELREYSILEKPFMPSELLLKIADILSQGKAAAGTG
jgi:DNA-binding NtrC family response regulator